MRVCWCVTEAAEYVRFLLARVSTGHLDPPGGLQEHSTGMSEPGLYSSAAQTVAAQLMCLRAAGQKSQGQGWHLLVIYVPQKQDS